MASSRVWMTFSMATSTKREVSYGTEYSTPSGKNSLSSARRCLTSSAVFSALAPGASCTAPATAGLPFRREEKL
ncbi:hypothetical protein D3C75_623770 [compost metagenome]